MIHPIVWALIANSPFISYFIMGAIVSLVTAYIEGRLDEDHEPDGMVFGAFIVWPLFLIGYAIWGFYLMVQAAFKAGRTKKK